MQEVLYSQIFLLAHCIIKFNQDTDDNCSKSFIINPLALEMDI